MNRFALKPNKKANSLRKPGGLAQTTGAVLEPDVKTPILKPAGLAIIIYLGRFIRFGETLGGIEWAACQRPGEDGAGFMKRTASLARERGFVALAPTLLSGPGKTTD
jgi:hypothetical protein